MLTLAETQEHIKKILEASRRNRLTFFVGAGVSRISGCPTWDELLYEIQKEMNPSAIQHDSGYSGEEALAIPQRFYISLNKDNHQYTEFIRKCIKPTEQEPNFIHESMLLLDPVSFATKIEIAGKSTLKTKNWKPPEKNK